VNISVFCPNCNSEVLILKQLIGSNAVCGTCKTSFKTHLKEESKVLKKQDKTSTSFSAKEILNKPSSFQNLSDLNQDKNHSPSIPLNYAPTQTQLIFKQILSNQIGVLSVFCISMSLLIGNFSFFERWSILPCAAGLMFASLELIKKQSTAKKTMPIFALLFGIPLVLVLLFMPGWLSSAQLGKISTRPEKLQTMNPFKPSSILSKKDFVSQDTPLQYQDIRLRLVNASITVPKEINNSSNRIPRNEKVAIQIRITNTGLTRQIIFSGWNENEIKIETPNGKQLEIWQPPLGTKNMEPLGEIKISPGKAIDQIIYCELPEKNIEELKIVLSGKVFSIEHDFRFTISKEVFSKKT
jgi:hypothetical protein